MECGHFSNYLLCPPLLRGTRLVFQRRRGSKKDPHTILQEIFFDPPIPMKSVGYKPCIISIKLKNQHHYLVLDVGFIIVLYYAVV